MHSYYILPNQLNSIFLLFNGLLFSLKVFGCFYFASTSSTHPSKFHPRPIPSIFVGYPPGMKGYQLYYIENQEFFISREVVFHEHLFPFHTVTKASVPENFLDLVLPKSFNYSTSVAPFDAPTNLGPPTAAHSLTALDSYF